MHVSTQFSRRALANYRGISAVFSPWKKPHYQVQYIFSQKQFILNLESYFFLYIELRFKIRNTIYHSFLSFTFQKHIVTEIIQVKTSIFLHTSIQTSCIGLDISRSNLRLCVFSPKTLRTYVLIFFSLDFSIKQVFERQRILLSLKFDITLCYFYKKCISSSQKLYY